MTKRRQSAQADRTLDPQQIVEALGAKLGYEFRDPQLLVRALTHSSALDPAAGSELADTLSDNYQRLEFLGDRVLGLVMAQALVEAFPHAAEGELALRLNALVNRDACAAAARAAELGPAILMSEQEASAGGREKTAILADVCESVIGALYLDGGLVTARDFIFGNWGPLTAAAPKRDAKTALQEWAQQRGLRPPEYALSGRSGPDHAPAFVINVTLDNDATAQGTGASKRAAEQQAAAALLAQLGVEENHRD